MRLSQTKNSHFCGNVLLKGASASPGVLTAHADSMQPALRHATIGYAKRDFFLHFLHGSYIARYCLDIVSAPLNKNFRQ